MSVCLSGPQCVGVYDFDVRCQVSDLAVSCVGLNFFVKNNSGLTTFSLQMILKTGQSFLG